MSFKNPFSNKSLGRKLTKEELIRAMREMVSTELEAANIYFQLAEAVSDDEKKVADILIDVAKEELIHVGEFNYALSLISPEDAELNNKGIEEAREKLGVTDNKSDKAPAKRKILVIKDE